MMSLQHLSPKRLLDDPHESAGLQIFTRAPDAEIHNHQGEKRVVTVRTPYDTVQHLYFVGL